MTQFESKHVQNTEGDSLSLNMFRTLRVNYFSLNMLRIPKVTQCGPELVHNISGYTL